MCERPPPVGSLPHAPAAAASGGDGGPDHRSWSQGPAPYPGQDPTAMEEEEEEEEEEERDHKEEIGRAHV